MGARVRELGAPVRRAAPGSTDADLAYVAATVRGHLRVLAGMVRANRPWRLVAGLSRALAAALAAGAFALVTSDIWALSAALAPVRLALLTVLSLGATIVSLIVAHGLWERPRGRRDRERVVLFNVATASTVTLGILALYAALFALTVAGALVVLDRGVLGERIGHHATMVDELQLAWLVSSLATVGGALGAAVESDGAVREAAYGRRFEDEGGGG